MNEKEFYEKIPEWIEHDWSRWNHITCLAYFCHKYEAKNNVRFRLVRGRKGPTVGKEASDFAKLFKTLAPEDYESLGREDKARVKEEVCKKIYNYINWMFDYKFRRGDRSVTGTRLFLIPSMINEFERMYSAFLKKKEESADMGALLAWCKKEVPEVFEMHQLERPEDLKMIERYTSMYGLDPGSSESRVLEKAKDMGLI